MVHLCQDMSLDFVRIIISKNSAPDWLNTDNLTKIQDTDDSYTILLSYTIGRLIVSPKLTFI